MVGGDSGGRGGDIGRWWWWASGRWRCVVCDGATSCHGLVSCEPGGVLSGVGGGGVGVGGKRGEWRERMVGR